MIQAPNVDIAIIGAGTAGCFLANQLVESGVSCRLIEKSRGLGGRCSRRQIDDGESIDIGASSFSVDTLENPHLQRKLTQWLEDGHLHPWQHRTSRFDDLSQINTAETVCASPSLNTWHKEMVKHIQACTGHEIHTLNKTGNYWSLHDEYEQQIISANKVIITTPPEQALKLVTGLRGFSYCQTGSDNSVPQYVCAIEFSTPLDLNAEIIQGGDNTLMQAVRETSKPQKNQSSREVWTLHSTYDWAQEQSGVAHREAAIALANHFCERLNINLKACVLTSHYWRLAKHCMPQAQHKKFIWEEDLQVGCCGDWLASGDIVGALDSSLALFEAITQK